MTIVGFNFTKIDVERKEGGVSGKIGISNNISIKGVEAKPLSLGKSNQDGLKFIFEFKSKYNPDIGSITLVGDVLYIEEKKKIENIRDGWKKSKRIPQEVLAPILNMALTRCNIQALILSQEINLPPPVPLPKIQPRESSEYIG